MESKIPCSVLILTRNSGKTLEKCLRNLSRFGEILIHDANSEDDTVEIAKRYGAKVLKQYDTEEKSVRVSDFTAMRFKQRDDAAYDWVLYLDSDEELTDELVAETGEILKTATPKTIVKYRRYPVVDGRVRTIGLGNPDIVPRIHHRKGGCTFKGGKTVHEKYVYDDTFTEVVAEHGLLVPLESLTDLRRKDDRYIRLEIERIWTAGYPWKNYLRWVLLREPLIMLSLLLRIARIGPGYFKKEAIPVRYDLRYFWYHWRLFRAITGAMLAHPLTSGRSVRS
jgi:glycosyltransferase involved in cell wall biosynthesis